MKKSLLTATAAVMLTAAVMTGSTTATEQRSQECFIGEVRLFAGNFAPRGYAKAEGQLLPIAQNQALFSILGTQYGGDGRTTFALPDMRENSGHNGRPNRLNSNNKVSNYVICLWGTFPSRS